MVATIAGRAAAVVADRFDRWRVAPVPAAVDRLCEAIREYAPSLPIAYFTEWIDRWLMGDLVPGPAAVEGQKFHAACMSPLQAVGWADRCGNQFAEQSWLASRLREAAGGRGEEIGSYVVVVIREVISASVHKDEMRAAASHLPAWLLSQTHRPNRLRLFRAYRRPLITE